MYIAYLGLRNSQAKKSRVALTNSSADATLAASPLPLYVSENLFI